MSLRIVKKTTEAAPALDLETGLPSKRALDAYVKMAGQSRQRLTLLALRWKGHAAPTRHELRDVAALLCACKDDTSLAARVAEDQFAVATCADERLTQTLVSSLKRNLEARFPVSVSVEACA